MAWNESFSAGGGWGGDSSFATATPAKDSAATKTTDRLPVPAVISWLHDEVGAEEKYTLGDYRFSTVMTMGVVASFEDKMDTNSVEYQISDPECPETTFKVFVYGGVGGEMDSRFVEGARVQVVGKLRSLAGDHGILSFGMREVVDDEEYHVFTLEAKIARQYFTKNVPNLLRTGEGQALKGTAAGAPSDQNAHSEPVGPASQPAAPAKNAAAATPGAFQTINQSDNQKKKISELLLREKDNYGEVGLHIKTICEKLKSDMNSVQRDLEFLTTEGHIYNTTGDDMFALIQ